MATKFQVDASATAYGEETSREEALKKRAEVYLGLTAVYAAIVTFVTEKAPPGDLVLFILFASSLLALTSGIVFSIISSTVATYEIPFGSDDIALEAEANPGLSEADFYTQRLADYAVAYTENIVVNERKARYLRTAATALWLGIILNGCYMADYIWENYVWLPMPTRARESPRTLTAADRTRTVELSKAKP